MLKQLKQLASESVIYGLSGFVSRFLSIFLVPIYTRLFTPADYGVMSLIGTTLALVGTFSSLGLDNAVHRWYWDTDEESDRKVTVSCWTWTTLGLSSFLTMIVLAAKPWLAATVIKRADAEMYLSLAALTLPLGVLGIVVMNWFRLQRRAWSTVSISLGTSIFLILLTLLLVVRFRMGLTGIYTAQVITATGGTVLAIILLRDWINPKWFQWSRLKQMLRYSFPLVPAALSAWIVSACGAYFIQFFSSTAEVGLYSIGLSLASGVALITGAFQLAWGPFAMSIHKKDDARQVYATVFLVYLWGGCLLSTGLTLFAPEILRILTTKSYYDAYTVVAPLSFSYVMTGLTYIAAVGPSIVRTTKPTGLAVTVAAGATIALNYLLVPTFGKEGAAIAALVAEATVPVYLFYRAQQLYPIPYNFRAGVGLILMSCVLILLGQSWQPHDLIAALGLKLLLLTTFLPLLFVLRIIPQGGGLLASQRT